MPARGSGQRLPEAELVTAYGQQERRGGRSQFDLDKHGQDGARAHGVGGEGRVPLRLQRAKVEGCRNIDTGIDEKNPLALPEIQGMFDLQLEVRQQIDRGQATRRLFFQQPVMERRPQRIVAA